MKKEVIDKISIAPSVTILAALKIMDSQKCKLLMVVENGVFLSLLSIGDIQRAIIANIPLTEPVSGILRSETRVAFDTDDRDCVIAGMKERRNEFMPVLNNRKEIVDVIFWEDIIVNEQPVSKAQLDLPVVIMAGGYGTRLRPLTNVLPKPLIPIGEKTMVEDIMHRFFEYGCSNFFLSVNYKADFIRYYLDTNADHDYVISYFQEDKPLGTAGSLYLLKDRIHSTFFVSNCDIIVNDDYAEMLNYHRSNKNEITIIAAVKTFNIPYGTLETGVEGILNNLQEKPELTYKINTGMYIIEPDILDEIPEDKFFHITHLMENLVKQGRRVGVYPINEGSWIDIGNWDEYIKFTKND